MSEHVVRTKYIALNDPAADPAWPTRRQDLLAALRIMHDYEARTGQPLRLLEDWGETAEGHFWVQFPEWVIELRKYYQTRYAERAEPILHRVLEELLPIEPLH